jgi:hypothetical protein
MMDKNNVFTFKMTTNIKIVSKIIITKKERIVRTFKILTYGLIAPLVLIKSTYLRKPTYKKLSIEFQTITENEYKIDRDLKYHRIQSTL